MGFGIRWAPVAWLAPLVALAGGADPCVSHCTLEPDRDGAVLVLCSCGEKKLPGGDDFFSLPARSPARFEAEVAKRLRGATSAESALVGENACASADSDEPLCTCVRNRTATPLRKRCRPTGAGEVACRFEPGAPSPTMGAPRPPTLVDYQACIANRMNYRHDSCLGDNCSEFPDAYEGGGDVKEWKVSMAPEFTKPERAAIEAAVAAIPACWKPAFTGIRISKQRLPYELGKSTGPLGKPRLLGCVGGEAEWEAHSISLDPVCMFSPGVIVHELFHILEGRARLYPVWKQVSDAFPNCPVTGYGRTSLHEDFAEAGRLLTYPKDDAAVGSKFRRACVDAKLEAIRAIVNACPEVTPESPGRATR